MTDEHIFKLEKRCMTTGSRADVLELISLGRETRAELARLRERLESLQAGAAQTELIRGLPLPRDVELLIDRAKAWHEWRAGCGGLNVHATESDLFDAVEAMK